MKKLLTIFIVVLAILFCTAAVVVDSIEWKTVKVNWIDPQSRAIKKIEGTALYYDNNGPICVYFPCPKGEDHIDLHTYYYGKSYFFEVENEDKAREGCLLTLDMLFRRTPHKEKKYEI